MVFGPPQHAPLGWLTPPPRADILGGSAWRRFRFYVGAYPQQRPIEISDSPFEFVRRTAQNSPRWGFISRGALSGPALKDGASRAHIDD